VPTLRVPTTTPPPAGPREIIILHTSDEHGALLPQENGDTLQGGALYAAANWAAAGLDPLDQGSNVLLLSGGDNWTGPAISTWFQGESTIEVMNALGYRASVLGNHEFDFGQEALRARQAQAQFPYLAANVFKQGTQEISDFAQPYLIVEVNDVRVGIIGLALRSTPSSTARKHLEGLSFGDYVPALRQWVPLVRQAGAQIIIVQSHICPQDLTLLAEQVRDLQIALFQGGHCHAAMSTTAGSALIAATNAHWRDYVRTRLLVDLPSGSVVDREQRVVEVSYSRRTAPRPDPTLQALVDKWQQRTETVLGEVIGYSATGIARDSALMHNLLVDSWLWAYDGADVAFSNVGGFRQNLPRGQITLGDVVGALPFDNDLYELEVTGAQLEAILAQAQDLVIGGLWRDAAGRWLVGKARAPLDRQRTYRLLTIDYVYDNPKYPFRAYDREPYETSIHWRQPTIDWIRDQRSTAAKPLESSIEATPRR
jgi:2',3'-cyclic-nucleotide 2'-phosphodiesterase (5'-nucleotidase family)